MPASISSTTDRSSLGLFKLNSITYSHKMSIGQHYTYWLAGQLPIMNDITDVLKRQLICMAINICECYGVQKFIIANDNPDDPFDIGRLNSLSWCLACRRSIPILPFNEYFWTRIFIYDGRWMYPPACTCICMYLPKETLCGYKNCHEMSQHNKGRNGHCRLCDKSAYL